MIANLLGDHDAVIRQLRRDLETCANRYRDMGTRDFLTGLMEQHEKMTWMLRAFLSQFSPCDRGKLEKYSTHPLKLIKSHEAVNARSTIPVCDYDPKK